MVVLLCMNDNLVTTGYFMSTMSAVISAVSRSGCVAPHFVKVIVWSGPAVICLSSRECVHRLERDCPSARDRAAPPGGVCAQSLCD